MIAALKDKALLRTQAFINGRWVPAEQKKTFVVKDPFSQDIIAEVPDMGTAETRVAIEAAHRALPAWRSKSASQRSEILRCWHDMQISHLDDLALLLTKEQGKPLREAKGEVKYGATFVEWFAEEAKRIYGDIIPGHAPDKRIMVIKQPIGVVAAITPWNFPHAMITRKVAPALAAGCTVVIKPAEDTPLSALALAELAKRAGFPDGVVNVVTSNQPQLVGEVLSNHRLVRKLSFTGSTETGKLLMRQCSGTVKKVSLELGGNAPFIVLNDADIDAAVAGAVASKYRNAGQTCVCANRFLVQADIYDSFLLKLSEATRQLRVGSGLEDEVDIGPLINNNAVEKVEQLLADAVQAGAQIITGGHRHPLGGTFTNPL